MCLTNDQSRCHLNYDNNFLYMYSASKCMSVGSSPRIQVKELKQFSLYIIQFIYLKTNKKHGQTKMFSKNAYSLWFPVDIPCMFFVCFWCFFLAGGHVEMIYSIMTASSGVQLSLNMQKHHKSLHDMKELITNQIILFLRLSCQSIGHLQHICIKVKWIVDQIKSYLLSYLHTLRPSKM